MATIAYNPIQVKTSTVAAGAQTFTVNVPTGRRLSALALSTAANNKQVTITSVKPYANKAQTVVRGAILFVASSTSVPVSTVTLASTTTTRGEVYQMMAHKPTASGSLCPTVITGPVSAYGYQVVVSCTATAGSGSWTLAAVSED